jgi:hypothetical protein
MKETLTSAEKVVQRKVERGEQLSRSEKKVIQARLAKAIQRRGTTIPGAIVSSQGDAGAVVALADQLRAKANPHVDSIAGSPIQAGIEEMLGNTMLPRKTATFYQPSTAAGLQFTTTCTVNLAVENPQAQQGPGGTGVVGNTLGTGGSAQSSSGQSSSSTSTTTVGASTAPPEKQGGTSTSASSSSSTTTGNTSGTQDTNNSTSSMASSDTAQRMTGNLVANVTVKVDRPETSGLDYINPFHWEGNALNAMTNNGPQMDSVACGTVTYQVSTGISSTPPPH